MGSTDGFVVNPSMSSLLAEYGEPDLEWEKKKIPISSTCDDANGDERSGIQERSAGGENRLGLQGKSPLHVELVSFGYRHGVPKELRDGWSYAQPIPPVDTRSLLVEVPSYLAWQDGLAWNVRHAVLRDFDRSGGSKARRLAADLADRAAAALVAAIDDGGHGFVSPLHVTVFVGSDNGRHRSVVVAELTATAIRNHLRHGGGFAFACPCSVSTRHMHLDRRTRAGTQVKAKAKQKDLEDDW
jgi:hypothetical protein